ncbi:MAG TPA: HEAT repeat domain-containing protein, partial [Gemmata sp.]
MRTIPALLLLSVALTAVPGADGPPAPLKSPTETDLDALVAEAAGRDRLAGAKAAQKLVALGPVAVPALTQGLWADSATRRACLRLLGAIGADARPAAPSLLKLLADDAPDVRLEAARVLGQIGAHTAVPALAARLDDPSAAVRLTAAEALVRLGARADALLPALTKALKSGAPDESYTAARLLTEL